MNDDEENLAEEGAATVREFTEDIESVLTQRGENRLKQWVLIRGRRSVVSLTLLGVVFSLLLALSLGRVGLADT